MAPSIDPTAGKDFEPVRARIVLPNAAAVQTSDAVRRFDVAVDVDRLVHVEPTVGTPTQRVQNMVRVFRAEAGEERSFAVGFQIAVLVGEVQQFGAIGDVRPAVARFDAGRNQQAVGEDVRLVGPAVAVGVFEHDDLVVGRLARLDLRIGLARGDPEPPLRIKVHLDRLRQQRIGGVEIDLQPLAEL